MKLIVYLSNGFPSLKESRERVNQYIKNGADMVEADFPTSNPYLDNDFLKKRIFSALNNTKDYNQYMDNILKIKNQNKDIDFLINIYETTVKEIGYDKFAEFMNKLNENQVLLAGNEYPEVREELEKRELYVSCLITREMCSEDLELAQKSNGFIYMQAFGDKEKYSSEFPTLKDCVKKVRSLINNNRKIYCGIGIHNAELLKEVYDSGADGAFLGSIILKKEETEQISYLKELRKIADGIRV